MVLQVTEKWFLMMDRSASQTAEVTWGEFLSVLCHWRWKSKEAKLLSGTTFAKTLGIKNRVRRVLLQTMGLGEIEIKVKQLCKHLHLSSLVKLQMSKKGWNLIKTNCVLINHQTQFINPSTETGQHNRSLVTGTTDYARCEMRNSDQCSWLKLRVAQSKQCKKWENGYWSFWLVLGGTLHRRRREQGAESKKEEKSIITHHKGACKQVVGFLLGLVLCPLRYAFDLPWAGYLGHFGTASV